MKLKLLAALLAFTNLLIAQLPSDRRIQNDPAAKEILDKVSATYHAIPSVKVSFTLLLNMPDEEPAIESKGTVYLKKEKYKIITDEMIIICDNVKRYIINIKDPQKPEALISFYDPEEEEIESPSELFDIYKDDFFHRLNGEITDRNRKLTVISLLPADIKNSPYKMVMLYVDKDKNQIAKGEILSKDGNRYTYTITAMEENMIADSEFTFDPAKYPGIYVDDMTQ